MEGEWGGGYNTKPNQGRQDLLQVAWTTWAPSQIMGTSPRNMCNTCQYYQSSKWYHKDSFRSHTCLMLCLQLCLRQELQKPQELPFHCPQRLSMLVLYAISSWFICTWFFTSSSWKKRFERQCASCRDHKCNKAANCAGRGGRSLCKCTDHPIIKNPRARTS